MPIIGKPLIHDMSIVQPDVICLEDVRPIPHIYEEVLEVEPVGFLKVTNVWLHTEKVPQGHEDESCTKHRDQQAKASPEDARGQDRVDALVILVNQLQRLSRLHIARDDEEYGNRSMTAREEHPDEWRIDQVVVLPLEAKGNLNWSLQAVAREQIMCNVDDKGSQATHTVKICRASELLCPSPLLQQLGRQECRKLRVN